MKILHLTSPYATMERIFSNKLTSIFTLLIDGDDANKISINVSSAVPMGRYLYFTVLNYTDGDDIFTKEEILNMLDKVNNITLQIGDRTGLVTVSYEFTDITVVGTNDVQYDYGNEERRMIATSVLLNSKHSKHIIFKNEETK